MSSFVHPENQRIIWNIINSNVYVSDFFQTNSHVSKNHWFRSIIEKFYMQNEGKNLSIEELNNLNKDVLTFMVKSIHSIPQQTIIPDKTPVPGNIYPSDTGTNYQINTPPHVQNTIGEQTNREFEQKKQEYEDMYAKQKPTEVDFRDNQKDTIIENMDELINKHISEREQQLKNIPPPMITSVKPVVTMPSDISNNSITFTIHEDKGADTNYNTSLKIEVGELKEKITQLQEQQTLLKSELENKYQTHLSLIEKLQTDIVTIRDNVNKVNNLDQHSDKSEE